MEELDNSKKYSILALPKWYPSKLDLQLGIFLKKHILAVAQKHKVHVLYVVGDKHLKTNFEFVNTQSENFYETIAYFSYAECKISPMKVAVNAILYLFAFSIAYFRFVKKNIKPDFIHVHIFGRTSLIAYFFKLFKSIPYIVSEQSSLFITDKFSKRNFFYRMLVRLSARNANLITAVSEVLKTRMLAYGLNNTYFVIPNVVEVSKNEIKFESKDKIIALSVADLFDKVKNISDVIKAVKYAIDEGYNFEYHIIGGGYDSDLLMKMAEKYGLLGKYIFFHGRQPNTFVLDFMHKIDFLITNSNYETFSVVTAEALANGKPVIATKCGGPESFVDSKVGILIDVGNLQQLKEALIAMLKTYYTYNSDEIINSVKTKFSFQSIANQFDEVYSNLFLIK